MKHLSLVILFVLASAATASAQAASTAAQSPGGKKTDTLQGFSVVLVLGDSQTNPPSEALPPAARAALNDMKDFLPYKSYHLLDTAWILGLSGRASTSRLRGPEERDYEVTLSGTAHPNLGVQVRFVLREPATYQGPDALLRQKDLAAEVANIRERRRALEAELLATRDKLSEKHPEFTRRARELSELGQRLTDLETQRTSASGETVIIDTGFKMDVGETVVVGTSRLRGDKALIALLTAVPRNK